MRRRSALISRKWFVKAHAVYTVFVLALNRRRWPLGFGGWLRARAVHFLPCVLRFWI